MARAILCPSTAAARSISGWSFRLGKSNPRMTGREPLRNVWEGTIGRSIMEPTRSQLATLFLALCLAGLASAQVVSQAPTAGGGSDLGALDLESLLSTKV